MRFYFHAEAETEFDRAIEYYEDCRRGLGIEFAQEVNETIGRIVQFPTTWTRLSTNTRRCLVNRFPFGIIYRTESGIIEIIAVADQRRRPNYWRNR
jgi:hypothetical protein